MHKQKKNKKNNSGFNGFSVLLCIWTEIQRQNEQRCEQEIEDIKRGVKAGNITPNTSLIRFSDDALDEQKHSIRIADEKVALAVQAYDLVCLSNFVSLYMLDALWGMCLFILPDFMSNFVRITLSQ